MRKPYNRDDPKTVTGRLRPLRGRAVVRRPSGPLQRRGDEGKEYDDAAVRPARRHGTRQIITSREQGKRVKTLSTNTIAKGNNDWLTGKQRDPGKPPTEELLVCRESQGCVIDACSGFLDQ